MTEPARIYRDPGGQLWHAVPTITQCEKVDLVHGRRPKGELRVYTNYDRFTTTYRVDEPTPGTAAGMTCEHCGMLLPYDPIDDLFCKCRYCKVCGENPISYAGDDTCVACMEEAAEWEGVG
jgi:hypothetical protein